MAIDLVLFDIPRAEKILKGLVMELRDCGYELLNSIQTAVDPATAF